MHAVSHTLAHRAQPAARNRARWQPYSSISLSSKSPTNYLITPASSLYSSPPSSRISEHERFPLQVSQSPPAIQPRDLQKTRYVVSLVDQAVKCLAEIWQPNIIPYEFVTSPRSYVLGDSTEPTVTCLASNSASRFSPRTHLPSPISPFSHQSPISPLGLTGQHRGDSRIPSTSQNNVGSLKGFVHEVLKRSRTSGTVLQTALCYLEAIRSKVPELAQQEKLGHDSSIDTDPLSRIIKPEDEEVDAAFEAIINIDRCIPTPMSLHDEVPVEESSDSCADIENALLGHGDISTAARKSKSPSPPLPPLPRLPSPLLCPRRAFLASLILASKFIQDRCYSNRAWAKLAGLPPREIGRCERALGDALQWRLWVGKKISTSQPASNNRPVVRCRSEGDLIPMPSDSASISPNPLRRPKSVADANRGLRRWSTLPADAFSSKESFGNLPTEFGLALDAAVVPRAAPVFPGPASPHPYSDHSVKSMETPSTPSLDSPSSSESGSSAGDRTVQMTFLDATSPPNQHSKPFISLLDKAPPLGSVFTAGPHIVGGDPVLYGSHALALQTVPVSITADSLASTVDAVQLY